METLDLNLSKSATNSPEQNKINLESQITSCGHVVPRVGIGIFPRSDGPMEPAVCLGRLSTHSVSIIQLNSQAKPVWTSMRLRYLLVTAQSKPMYPASIQSS